MKEDWTQHRLPPVVRSRVQGATGHDPWSQENESLFAEVLFQRRPDRPAASMRAPHGFDQCRFDTR